jgi:hypothetical protein
MGTLASITSVEVAGTKAKAAAFNNAMTEIFGVLNDGSREIYNNTHRLNRSSSSDMTYTGSDCALMAYHTIGTATTYDFATSTARGVCFGEITLGQSATLHIASSAVFRVI